MPQIAKVFQGAGALRENHVQYYRNIVEWEVALWQRNSLRWLLGSPSGWAGECLSLSCAEPMGPGEEGFSGAKLLRLRCTYADGGEATCIAKHTTWQERAVMQTFTGQGAGLYPSRVGHPGNHPQEDAWLLLEDVSPSQPLPTDTLAWKAQVAQALAAPPRGQPVPPRHPGLAAPPPKRAIGSGVTTALSLDHLQRQCQQDGAFSRRYGGLLPQLYKRGERFVREMLALSKEEATLTVTPRRPANHLRGPRAPLPG